MYLLRPPADDRLHRFLAEAAALPLTYSEVGASRGTTTPPPGFHRNHARALLGHGEDAFDRAKAALHRWAMYDMSWVCLVPAHPPVETGSHVVMLVSHFGFHSVFGCRVVYTYDEEDAAGRRVGFGIGTLAGHLERGEERFSVEWDRASDRVEYEIFSFTRPGRFLVRLGGPLSRGKQRQFARESSAWMQRAVDDAGTRPG